MLHFCFASGSCIFATMCIPACCTQASAEVFSPLNSHRMKEQLDLWPSLRSWPIDSRPSRFYSRKGSAGERGLCHLEDLLEPSFNKEKRNLRATVYGRTMVLSSSSVQSWNRKNGKRLLRYLPAVDDHIRVVIQQQVFEESKQSKLFKQSQFLTDFTQNR